MIEKGREVKSYLQEKVTLSACDDIFKGNLEMYSSRH